ncbi:MAG: hypothetical protein ACRDJH_12190, partial [Thermomicrobiales bacterium]
MLTWDRTIATNQPHDGRSPLVAAALSALVPGAGQLYQGRRRRGAAMLGLTLLIGGAALTLWRLDPFQVLAWLVRTEVLVALLVADMAVLAFRLFAVLDAYRGRRTRRVARTMALALLLLATAAPHAALGYYDVLTLDAIVKVFPADDDESGVRERVAPRGQVTTTLPVVLKPIPI